VIRVPASLVEDLLSLVGESMILTTQVRERVRRAREQMVAMQGQFGLLKQLGHDLEELVDVSDLRGSATSARGAHGFDALELDEYSELHTHSRRLVEAATDARELGRPLGRDLADLEDMLVTQERLDRETQDMVLRTRMVAVKAVFPRLQRAVRQVCRLTGKQATLELSGGGTLIDSDILGDVADALMHLLRNAVDHGIEAPEQRAARGKESAGSIRVDFGREGNQILIRCADDGGGLDHEAIRGAAVEQALIPDAASLGDEDLKRLVLRASFSTRREVSQTSGRGIGLDAVHGRVTGLGGSVTLESEPGRGLAVELRLPVTLISSHALLVRAGRHVVAVANRGVTRILPGDAGELRTEGAVPAYHTGDEAFPAVGLGTLLDAGADARESARGPRPVLLVQGDDGVTAVLAEALLDSRDLVVKPLGEYLPKRRGLVGATILGDGAVAPVLDLPELLRTRDAPLLDDVSRHGAETGEIPPLPTALVVDDSLSARRALAQCMEDAGYRVRVARDGVEAAEIAAHSRPDIVLADLEMPRMNGIELVAHLRARAATRTVPAIMVTSRSTAKHRRQAEEAGVDRYLVKPFSDDVLLDHVRELTGGR
jgi:chemosensory pili system protein ChpA (sensor histidine kinase/response regulator)